MKHLPRPAALLGFVALLSLASPVARAEGAMPAEALGAFSVPGLAAASLQAALRAYHRAVEAKTASPGRLTVIDYSLPSTHKRLWVIDPERGKVLFAELVAHGKGSGDLVASRFGNTPESHQTSLGVFRTAETYQGSHGYSLRLDGLEKGVNDQARARDIVFHAANYVSAAFGLQHGRLGRSFGCPALDPSVSRTIIDAIRGGSIVVALAAGRG